MIKILDKYIINEISVPFFFGIAIFTLLFIASGLLFQAVKMLVQHGIPFIVVGKFLLGKLPAIIVYTLPMSTLLAALLAFGRLSGENEIIALKAGGISFYRIVLPAILFALGVTIFSIYFNDHIVPRATYMSNYILYSQIKKQNPKLFEDITLRTTTRDGLERITFARFFNEEKGVLKDTMVHDFRKEGGISRSTYAQEAKWGKDGWKFIDGVIVHFDEKGTISYQTTFRQAHIYIPQTPEDIRNRQKKPEEMSREELSKKIKLISRVNARSDSLRSLKLQFHMKLSLPCASLVFATIGIPFGLKPHRTSSSVGLGLSLVIIFIYYIIMFLGMTLGESGLLPPFISVWLPNIIFFLVGIIFIIKAGQ